MEITRRLDWLQYTHHDIDNWQRRLPFSYTDDIREEIKPLPRYARAYSLLGGGRVDIATDAKQGTQVTMGGQALTEWVMNGGTFQAIINDAVSYAKVVRLDFATDIRQNPYSAEHVFWREVEMLVANNAYVSRLKADNEIRNKKRTGYTQYFGSYKSDQFIRVYDKNAESGLLLEAMKQHLTIESWSRVEIVCKRDFAHNLASDMAFNGWQQAGTAKLRSMINFPLSETWARIIDGISVELTKVGRRENKWRKWMNNQVLPSIVQHAKAKEDMSFILEWLEELGELIGDID